MSPAATARAAVLGISAGMRTFTPHGALALRGRYGHGAARTGILLAAGGELVGDKLPPRRRAR